MLNIYLLEDYQPFLTFLTKSVQNVLMVEALTAINLVAETDPRRLIAQIDVDALDTSLFFLDIEISASSEDGVMVADWIRTRSATAEIVFVTSHAEAALQILTHQIAPLDLIPKTEDADAVVARIHADVVAVHKRQVDRQLHTPRLFSYGLGSRVFSIPLAELEYIQTVPGAPGELKVHSQQETATFSGNLNQIEAKFPMLFRCHKSTLINPKQVQSLDAKQRFVYFSGGARVEVSYRKLAGLRKLLLA
ncbi:LytR/AlgR family response regulator transcription factor [Lacticaseibacillus sp. GG6-2]